MKIRKYKIGINHFWCTYSGRMGFGYIQGSFNPKYSFDNDNLEPDDIRDILIQIYYDYKKKFNECNNIRKKKKMIDKLNLILGFCAMFQLNLYVLDLLADEN